MIVRESILFQRGKDPKISLGLGEHNPEKIAEIREKLGTEWLVTETKDIISNQFLPNELHPLEEWILDNEDLIGKRFQISETFNSKDILFTGQIGNVAYSRIMWFPKTNNPENEAMKIDNINIGLVSHKPALYIRSGIHDYYATPEIIEKYFVFL